MATFLMFGTYSSEALKGISATRTEMAVNILKQAGGEVKSAYIMLGDKDLVLVVDLPGVEQAIQASIALTKSTGVSFTTSPAITVEEFDKLPI